MAAQLKILAEGRWPDPDDPDGLQLPPLPGFTASSFNPLVAETAERCLRAHHGDRVEPSRTALLLASHGGDRATALAIDTAAAADRQMPPLLFFQSNPNAVLGHVAARHRLTGPVVAISPTGTGTPGEVPSDALELAELLLLDGDADQVLVIAAEPAEHSEHPEHPHRTDRAVAVLVTTA
ncbi:hypothetical protein ACEZCY_20410 [Streptacidiphilus sp. N1-12]|uniref:Beta-ketoacyl synthase, N-terminal domain n=2 Tax=Streptacidiphilus alkalitolerans TaxID=3342712 RepID=A0ABV6X2A9_9ACTN